MSRRNENGISMNRAFAKLLSDGSEVDRLRAELDELRGEVREWLCAKCNMVYPGPPGKGVSGILCRTCGGLTGPRNGTELRRARAREKRMRAALIRLRDCDWVITLPNRMDAVREIAREGLEEP